MNVAYLLDRFPVTSQTFVRLEIDELRRQGTDVEVFALRRGDDGSATAPQVVLREIEGGKARHLLAHIDVARRHPVRYLRFWRAAWLMRSERKELLLRRLPAIARRIEASGAARIHAHFAWSGAALAHLVSELTGLPWSMTVHGNDVFGETRNLEEKLRAADCVVTVCEYLRDHLERAHGIEAEVVVCGVEPAKAVDDETSGPDIVFVGRLVEKKGIDVLLRAVDPAWSIDIVGDGPELAAAQRLAAERKLPKIRFLGGLDHDATLGQIARARLLCLPARIARNGDRDSMPVVVKEAMIRGVPVVATSVAGIPEMIDDETGWLVPPDDPDALRAALTAALGDPTAAATRAQAARARARDRFALGGEVAKLRTRVLV